MQKFGELNFIKTGLKFEFGVNPQYFSHELCLYITRFASKTAEQRGTAESAESKR